MRTVLAPLAAIAAIALAAPGHADPGVVEASAVDPSEFITALHQVGITFADPAQAVAAGQAVCGLVANGETGLELLTDLREANPALTINGAAQFAAIAAKTYCPQQLTPAKSAK
ncbi:DUF732 domain-containing protein [Mycolicibacter terrae]|uniref:DUF732 domain-containing protein n=2 Tax=Mycolicibacter TaxID=1073531 RepID=A0A1A2Y8P7_MYCSD|nr:MULTISPECIES: DUF732 domain-containing protein [Mycolicibacter]OBH19889.1 hypothetical protein A5694_00830 [Mycolicibacter sinensis]OBI33813.1 hypothetical protein A5710_12755 [Mycolicibacter sinensis]RRR48316.1 DUF732 domain-containing protein [Mycolicibacter terrae]